ncbi:golgin subfamily A member 6-like protein 26 [Palaemon carinicauda]|uniref:golgin subfamily A member 6-like protein 26 n=1 Tax=Palaemon carinicauda TaxID=392227 RepID=UPI0035B610E3
MYKLCNNIVKFWSSIKAILIRNIYSEEQVPYLYPKAIEFEGDGVSGERIKMCIIRRFKHRYVHKKRRMMCKLKRQRNEIPEKYREMRLHIGTHIHQLNHAETNKEIKKALKETKECWCQEQKEFNETSELLSKPSKESDTNEEESGIDKHLPQKTKDVDKEIKENDEIAAFRLEKAAFYKEKKAIERERENLNEARNNLKDQALAFIHLENALKNKEEELTKEKEDLKNVIETFEIQVQNFNEKKEAFAKSKEEFLQEKEAFDKERASFERRRKALKNRECGNESDSTKERLGEDAEDVSEKKEEAITGRTSDQGRERLKTERGGFNQENKLGKEIGKLRCLITELLLEIQRLAGELETFQSVNRLLLRLLTQNFETSRRKRKFLEWKMNEITQDEYHTIDKFQENERARKEYDIFSKDEKEFEVEKELGVVKDVLNKHHHLLLHLLNDRGNLCKEREASAQEKSTYRNEIDTEEKLVKETMTALEIGKREEFIEEKEEYRSRKSREHENDFETLRDLETYSSIQMLDEAQILEILERRPISSFNDILKEIFKEQRHETDREVEETYEKQRKIEECVEEEPMNEWKRKLRELENSWVKEGEIGQVLEIDEENIRMITRLERQNEEERLQRRQETSVTDSGLGRTAGRGGSLVQDDRSESEVQDKISQIQLQDVISEDKVRDGHSEAKVREGISDNQMKDACAKDKVHEDSSEGHSNSLIQEAGSKGKVQDGNFEEKFKIAKRNNFKLSSIVKKCKKMLGLKKKGQTASSEGKN